MQIIYASNSCRYITWLKIYYSVWYTCFIIWRKDNLNVRIVYFLQTISHIIFGGSVSRNTAGTMTHLNSIYIFFMSLIFFHKLLITLQNKTRAT